MQTKWVSERLLTQAYQRGMDIHIYRPYWITGQSDTGICMPELDHHWRLIQCCIQTGFAPDWEVSFGMMPVDFVSQAIVALGERWVRLEEREHEHEHKNETEHEHENELQYERAEDEKISKCVSEDNANDLKNEQQQVEAEPAIALASGAKSLAEQGAAQNTEENVALNAEEAATQNAVMNAERANQQTEEDQSISSGDTAVAAKPSSTSRSGNASPSQSAVPVYHLANAAPVSWKHLIEWMNENGYAVQMIPGKEWHDTYLVDIDENNALYPLLSLYLGVENAERMRTQTSADEIISERTRELMQQMKLANPLSEKYLLGVYFEYLKRVGFFC